MTAVLNIRACAGSEKNLYMDTAPQILRFQENIQCVSKEMKRKLTDFHAGYIEFNDLIVTYYERAVI